MARQFSVAPTAATTAAAINRADRPETKVWMNVGVMVGDTFVSLPIGVGIDTMQAADERTNSAEYSQLVQARNALLKKLQSFSEDLKPGEEANVDGLLVQIRRVNDKQAPDASKNSLLDGINSLFA